MTTPSWWDRPNQYCSPYCTHPHVHRFQNIPAPERPTIDETIMEIAYLWSKRSTCNRGSRGSVGAVLARDSRVIGTGYNGVPPGMRHCQHDGIVDDARSCVRAIHAERNALNFAARHGVRVEGATLYTTVSPCIPCCYDILACGIVRVVYHQPYRITDGLNALLTGGVEIFQMPWTEPE